MRLMIKWPPGPGEITSFCLTAVSGWTVAGIMAGRATDAFMILFGTGVITLLFVGGKASEVASRRRNARLLSHAVYREAGPVPLLVLRRALVTLIVAGAGCAALTLAGADAAIAGSVGLLFGSGVAYGIEELRLQMKVSKRSR